MVNIDDVIAQARLPETTETLCLRGDLQAEWEELDRVVRASQEHDDTLGGSQEARDAAARMQALEAQMREHEVTFRLRGIPASEYSDLLVAHRLPEDRADESPDGLDWRTFPAALIAACAVDPAMTVAQARKLADKISHRQWDDLYVAAMSVNRSKINVPKSLAASAIMASTVPKQRPPANGASPAPSSSAESLAG